MSWTETFEGSKCGQSTMTQDLLNFPLSKMTEYVDICHMCVGKVTGRVGQCPLVIQVDIVWRVIEWPIPQTPQWE